MASQISTDVKRDYGISSAEKDEGIGGWVRQNRGAEVCGRTHLSGF
jgi:hypothetical protein